MAKIISIAGKFCSGKGTVAATLEKELTKHGHSVARLSFSSILKETLGLWRLPASRDNLQNLGLVMRQIFGPDVVSNYVFNEANSSTKDYVIIDGFRTAQDWQALQDSPNATQIYIEAPDNLRFQWMLQRQEKIGEQHMTLEEFKQRNQHPVELEIPKFKNTADYIFINNQHLDNLIEFCQTIASHLSSHT